MTDKIEKIAAGLSKPRGIEAMFFRDEGFYSIQFLGEKSPEDEAADHARCNPGTLRIEDVTGNVLWEAGDGAG